ncbi:MAG: glutamate formimidoyltransferase [Candidatus Cloacimonetes bacterium]|nr:glutamate formimidoyltransferase [Candidatus Cloacimonadota bacterium]MBS3766794.1 glutamate formimidoyltransferase [Candidatus Cloacimonadota bacterium]
MDKIVECVPNFSEGRDKEIIGKIADSVRAVEGAKLLDVDPGEATNRTVFTFVGTPEGIKEAAFQAIKTGSELIDMREHEGEHARMGACDVCPFVPVGGVDIDDCVRISREVGKRVAEELNIPIYLYEHSRTKPDRKNLAVIRKGEYEGLKEKLKDPHWQPDFGKAEFNPKSGATAMGCRDFLIAYNINLNTRNKKLAHDIALNIREKGRILRNEDGVPLKDENGKYKRDDGGFKGVKAVGWYIDEYDKAQISMNITNYKASPIHKIFEYVEKDAIKHGLRVTGSELVGLIPKEPIVWAGRYFLEKQHLDEDQYISAGVGERELVKMAIDTMGLDEVAPFDVNEKIIEYTLAEEDQLRKMTVIDFADELSSDSPAPGGGSVAALSGTLAAGLSAMVANLSTKKLTFRQISEAKKKKREELNDLAFKAQQIKDKLLTLIDEDTKAFEKFMAANRLSEDTEEEKEHKEKVLQDAIRKSIEVPLETMRQSFEAIKCAKVVAEKGMKNAMSDAGVSAITGLTAVKSAMFNVKINLPGIKNEEEKEKYLQEANKILENANKLGIKIENLVNKNLG